MRTNTKTLENAFVYITDCNLATVTYLTLLKRKTKSEYERQINIAQTMVDCIQKFELNPGTTRAVSVMYNYNGSVKDWSKQFEEDG